MKTKHERTKFFIRYKRVYVNLGTVAAGCNCNMKKSPDTPPPKSHTAGEGQNAQSNVQAGARMQKPLYDALKLEIEEFTRRTN